jgi:hypothetical protein
MYVACSSWFVVMPGREERRYDVFVVVVVVIAILTICLRVMTAPCCFPPGLHRLEGPKPAQRGLKCISIIQQTSSPLAESHDCRPTFFISL